MQPSLGDRLAHILTAIDDIHTLLDKKSRSDFADDRLLRITVERLYEIISEASRHIPQHLRNSEPGIAWPRLGDIGNWLRHAYHRVDADILWNIYKNDLDRLQMFVERIVHDTSRR